MVFTSYFGRTTLITRTAIALPLILLWLSCTADALPLFGLFDGDENGTSILAALALAHIQHTVNKLEQLAELGILGLNFTAAAFG